MDNKMIFDIFKNIIIEQNKLLLKTIAEKHNLDYDYLLEKYIAPQYYLPVILSTKKQDQNVKSEGKKN